MIKRQKKTFITERRFGNEHREKEKIKLDPILLSDPMYAGVRHIPVLSLFQDHLSQPFPDRQNGTG